MAKMELLLIRHGETDWNTANYFRGHEDVKLNAVGIAQAEATAEALKDTVFEAIYSSPLKRSLVTAVRIAKPHEMTVRERIDLLDINFGTWQGKKESDVQAAHSKLYQAWLEKPGKVKFPGGESTKKAWKRVNSGLREILFTHGTGTVVIVSHRVPLKLMTAYLLKKTRHDIGGIRHDPCAISRFEVTGREYKPVVLNDSSHLAKFGAGQARDF